MSDIFMHEMFKDNMELTEYVLNVVMERVYGKGDVELVQEETERLNASLTGGKSTVHDVYAVDTERRKYNLEVQQDNSGASPKRGRYYGNVIDRDGVKEGDEYPVLPASYVIFFTGKDYYRKGRAVYVVNRTVDDEFRYGDELTIMYVNTEFREYDADGNETEFSQLMHDFHTADPAEMKTPLMREAGGRLKNTEGGRRYMCDIMNEAFAQVRAKAKDEDKREIASNLIEMGNLTDDFIAKATELSKDVVASIRASLKTAE